MLTSETNPGTTLRLRDGRQLAYAEFGDPRGAPVVFLHGWCGSRLYPPPGRCTDR